MCGISVEPRIETERLVLTPASADYADRAIPLINDIDIARMTSRIPHPYGAAEAEAFRHSLGRKAADRDRLLQIETQDGELIGAVGASFEDGLFPEIGYWIGRDQWGRGYATEAALAIRDWARRTFDCRALIAGHFADDAASGRVLVKCGFLYTGEVQAALFACARRRGGDADDGLAGLGHPPAHRFTLGASLGLGAISGHVHQAADAAVFAGEFGGGDEAADQLGR